MISQTAEYALRAVVHLASVEKAGTSSQTTQQIADATLVPLGYLSKVLQGLSRAGVIVSQRGLGGGFSLARAATAISVFDVVQKVDPIGRIAACPLGLEAHGAALCALHKSLDEAAAALEKSFRDTSIAALVADPNRGATLCVSPQ